MTDRSRPMPFVATAAFVACALAGPPARADQPVPSPSPTPADPCGGPGRLLATANRPTVGFSACAVKRNAAVFELGYQNTVRGTAESGSVESQVPQNFLRIGVADRIEFDVIGPNYEGIRTYGPLTASETFHGVTDSGLGFKYEFVPSGRLTLALDGLYTGPNGSPELTAGNATVTGNVDASYALSPAMAVGTTVGISSTGSITNGIHYRYGVTTPSLVVTAQIPHYYQFYAEYVYISKTSGTRGGVAFTDFGVQKLLGTRTEIDVEYGHAFTGDAAQRFDYIGSGVVVQLW